jgi:hypothetical protein
VTDLLGSWQNTLSFPTASEFLSLTDKREHTVLPPVAYIVAILLLKHTWHNSMYIRYSVQEVVTVRTCVQLIARLQSILSENSLTLEVNHTLQMCISKAIPLFPSHLMLQLAVESTLLNNVRINRSVNYVA